MGRASWWWVGILATACGAASPAGTDLASPDAPPPDAAAGDPGGSFDPGILLDGEPGTPADTPCVPAPFPGSPAGTWAQVQVREAVVNSPSLADVRRTYTTLALWTVTGDGEDLEVRSTVCEVRTDSPDSPVKTIIPLALVRSIPEQDLPCSARAEGEGWHLVQDRHVEIRGAVLAHPDTDPLPTDPGDPAVVDQDRDGQPGVTVLLAGLVDGAVYVVQRIWTELEGCSDAAGGFQGSVSWGEEQVVLGADNPVLVMQSVITPIPGAGRFWMRPVPAGTDCDYLVAHRQEILGE